MCGWRWTTVLVNALYWGVFFFTCNVIISKFTVGARMYDNLS